jgi:hypothetical protein
MQMSGFGNGGTNPTAPVLGATTAAVLPVTGMNSAIQIALAVAAGLAVWALVYVATSKFSKR